MKFKKIICLLLAFAMIFALAACGSKNEGTSNEGSKNEGSKNEGSKSESSAAKDTVTTYINGDIPTFDNYNHTLAIQSTIEFQIFNFPLTIDVATGKEVFDQALTGYEVSDDGLTYTLHVREGMKFHNGDEVTAEDVAFSINRLIGSPYIGSYVVGVKECVVIDKYTVEMRMETVTAEIIQNLAGSACIVDKKVLEENPDAYIDHPIGSGPYKFVSYTTGDRIVLERFDDYWAGPAKIKNAIFRIIPDLTTATISMQSGDIDVGQIANESLENVEADAKLKTVPYKLNGTTLFFINLLKYPDKTVREAMAYAINREFILKSIGGYGEVAESLTNPIAMLGTDGLVDNYDYDLEKAKAKVAEAGCAGMAVNITTVAGNAQFESIASIIQQNLNDAGFNATVEPIEKATLIAQWGEGNFDVGIITLMLSSPSSYAMVAQGGQGGMNFCGVDDPQIDAWFAEAAGILDTAKRREVYVKLFNKMAEDINWIGLIWPQQYYAANKDLDIGDISDGILKVYEMEWK